MWTKLNQNINENSAFSDNKFLVKLPDKTNKIKKNKKNLLVEKIYKLF